MITTVLFDLGGVLELVDDANWPKQWLHHWFDRLGIPREEGWHRLAEADLPNSGVAEGTELPYMQAVGRALDLTQTQLDLVFADMWDRYCGKPNEELFALARELHGRVRLGILSNSGDGARREEERRYGLSRLFDPILYSHEIGMEKPAYEVFRYAARACGAEPSQVLFVDNLPENVEAAAHVGMRTHLHVDNASTIEAVRAAVGRHDA